jgi:hypothetical protein
VQFYFEIRESANTVISEQRSEKLCCQEVSLKKSDNVAQQEVALPGLPLQIKSEIIANITSIML